MSEPAELHIDPERVIRALSQRLAAAVEENARLEAAVQQLVVDRTKAGNEPAPKVD